MGPGHLGPVPEDQGLLREVEGLQVAGYAALGPRSHLPRHQGPVRSFRYHLGLRVPGSEGACRLRVGEQEVPWREATSLAFDDRTPHEAWNDTDEWRYVLFVQTGIARGGVSHRLAHWLMSLASRDVPAACSRPGRPAQPGVSRRGRVPTATRRTRSVWFG